MSAETTPSSVSIYDARPFFEKALQYGLQNGIIDQQKLDAICTDAPKGMVQIARYFGTEFLRPELERAKDRMVNLVSLYLEASTSGDLQQAAESLRDHSFLSRSKGGSDMLKALIAMPQNSHFGMNERGGFNDDHIPLLAKWALRSLPDYQAELAKREQVARVIGAAVWLAGELGLDADDLEEAGADAEALIRTALLAMVAGRRKMPDWVAFDKMIASLRKKHSADTRAPTIALPQKLPANLRPVVEAVRKTVLADLPKILDTSQATRRLFNQTPAFMGRYFWLEDALSEVDEHDRTTSGAWDKITGGNSDDGSLLTLFFCVSAHAAPKTLLTEKSAGTLIRKIQKAGFKPEAASQYIASHAPAQYRGDYARLWTNFVEEAQTTLQSDAVGAFEDALALLRRECNVK
ncbi:MAG: hypothetical protein H7228_00570 [Polaromonas sp.]|nr:hypothetical protein [Polaromonas sp.]